MVTKKRNLKTAYERGKRAYRVLTQHRYTTIAGTLVFFLVTSIVPFLFWLTLLFGGSNVGREEILGLELFGWAKELLIYLQTNAQGASGGASIFFLATTLWSSSSFFYHLRRSGEIVYAYKRPNQGWRVRISAILVTLAVLLFFAAAGAVLLAGIFARRFLSPWIGYPAEYALLLILGFFAAWILNAYVCPYRVSPTDTLWGSLLTALLWLVASAAFAVYLKFSSREKLYGALSLVIVFLLWLYWMMICFTVGMIYNRRHLRVRGRKHKRL
ncbi:MAG: YihY/virulence factor BrkB family protein [Clostridia bacterium]|nr:YihY/virulence factor BrkB family protein [Clostridia bacterium]